MNEPLKLFIVGEVSGNTDEWVGGGGRTLVVARTAVEANELSDGHSAEEIVIGSIPQILIWDEVPDNL